jgi:hypothetical protein
MKKQNLKLMVQSNSVFILAVYTNVLYYCTTAERRPLVTQL